MDFSFYTHGNNFALNNGHSVAGYEIVTSLQRLGHNVWFNSRKPTVQLVFCQPPYFADVLGSQYTISLCPWESTALPPDWKEIFEECNEVWATSPWVEKVYKDNNIKVTQTYLHGIGQQWKPLLRQKPKVMNFLHHGSESERKGGQQAYDAFKKVFGDSKHVHLYIKCKDFTLIRRNTGTIKNDPNVTLMPKILEESKLIQLYNQCHVNIYSSAGEGFGLSPAQSIATGMPTICTSAWAPYKDFLGPLALASNIVDSKWPDIHPGKMYEPDFKQLCDLIQYSYYNYEELSNQFFKQSFNFHKQYDWTKLTEKAFENVVKKFK